MPTPPPPITPYATPPSSDDPVNFDPRADAKVADDVTKVAEYEDLADNVYANAGEAYNSAVAAAASKTAAEAAQAAAQASAAAAASSAGAALWVSGSYTTGQAARSPSDFRVYFARTTGAKPTDPALDPTNWAVSLGNELLNLTVTGTTQTAAVGARYWLRNAAQSTLTAPPAPQPGDRFSVKVANGRTDNVINWNGAKHEGISDATMGLASPYLCLDFVYLDTTYGWGIA